MSDVSELDISPNRKRIYKILKAISLSEGDILKIWPESAPLNLVLHAKDEIKEVEFRILVLADQSEKEIVSCITNDEAVSTSFDFDDFIKFTNKSETTIEIYALIDPNKVNLEIFEESDYTPHGFDYNDSSTKMYRFKITISSNLESKSNELTDDMHDEDILIETPNNELIHARARLNSIKLSNILSRATQFSSDEMELILSGIDFCTEIILHAISSNGFEAEYKMAIDEYQSAIESIITNYDENINADCNCSEIFEDLVDNNNCYVEVFFVMPKCKMSPKIFSEAKYCPWHDELIISSESCICTLKNEG